MAEQLQLMLDGTAPVPVEKRKSYTREEKLKVVKFYLTREIMFQTRKKLSLNTKNILRWIQAISSLFPNFLFPVTSQVTWPPCKIKCHMVCNSSRGKLLTIPPYFTMEMVYLLWLFPVSECTKMRSPNSEVRTDL